MRDFDVRARFIRITKNIKKRLKKAKNACKNVVKLIKIVKITKIPKITFSVERWKWSEKYGVFVSNKGRILGANGTLKKQYVSMKNGYSAVYIGNPKHIKNVHRIVMETWKPIENADQMTVDHIDSNRRNNCLKNLEWTTQEENWERMRANGICE